MNHIRACPISEGQLFLLFVLKASDNCLQKDAFKKAIWYFLQMDKHWPNLFLGRVLVLQEYFSMPLQDWERAEAHSMLLSKDHSQDHCRGRTLSAQQIRMIPNKLSWREMDALVDLNCRHGELWCHQDGWAEHRSATRMLSEHARLCFWLHTGFVPLFILHSLSTTVESSSDNDQSHILKLHHQRWTEC